LSYAPATNQLEDVSGAHLGPSSTKVKTCARETVEWGQYVSTSNSNASKSSTLRVRTGSPSPSPSCLPASREKVIEDYYDERTPRERMEQRRSKLGVLD
jgi:hypothetical protein